MECIAPATWSAELDRIEPLAEAQRDFQADMVQLSPGRFRYGLRLVDLGPLRVQSNDLDGSYLGRARVPPGTWALFFPTGGPEEASRLNGMVPGRADAVLYGPHAELHARVSDGQRWTMAVFDDGRFREIFDRIPAACERRAVHLPGLLARAPGLLRLEEVHGAVAGGAAGAAVSEGVVDGLCAALDGAFTAGASSARRVRAEGRAVRVASAAVAYLEAARGRAVFSHEIGAAIGVSPRFVNQCFDAVFGMSVHRYLRLRRLAEARRRLMAGGDGLLVKQVALDLGLWHFGRFASAYQAQFGETPSQTLAAGGRRPHR
ncbi:helix-turn-helix domain-containing protein [Neoroseomonas oryzicola]|uniref:helix-turn-helix domain-containing protein n=1 Tax=Neoroseomonas oryzicola TaxID=535904 RepID=UPI001AE0C887|nr:helix-turn-helix domain-containing protein [Neoroseomonas oryzicola]